MPSLYVLMTTESPISTAWPQHELVELQQKVSKPSWTVAEDTLINLYRRSWGKHPDTPDVENVNTFAKFCFRNTGYCIVDTGALQDREAALTDLNAAINEAAMTAARASVPFYLVKMADDEGEDIIRGVTWENDEERVLSRWYVVKVKL